MGCWLVGWALSAGSVLAAGLGSADHSLAGNVGRAGAAARVPEEAQALSLKMVWSHGLGDFYSNRSYKSSLATSGWDYVSGLVACSILKAREQYPGNDSLYAAVKAFADRCTSSDGSAILNSSGGSALGYSNLDDLAAGKIFFALYREELRQGHQAAATRYKNAATLIRNTLSTIISVFRKGCQEPAAFFTRRLIPIRCGWMDCIWGRLFMLNGRLFLAATV
jgi:unsaturated rhamnogalacturonyl hydrolase